MENSLEKILVVAGLSVIASIAEVQANIKDEIKQDYCPSERTPPVEENEFPLKAIIPYDEREIRKVRAQKQRDNHYKPTNNTTLSRKIIYPRKFL